MAVSSGSLGISTQGRTAYREIVLRSPSGWREEIVDWYKELSSDAKSIRSFEVRKSVSRWRPPHQFIVLHMCDNKIHRFDRRLPRDSQGKACFNTAVLLNRPVESEDCCTLAITPDSRYWRKIAKKSELKLELHLDGKVDIWAVIVACHAISRVPTACQYTLGKYNCFFFAWAIMMVVSRHHLRLTFELPPLNFTMDLFQSHLERLSSYIVDETIELLPKIVMDAVGVFRARAGKASRQGMHMLERTVWATPMGVIGFCYQQFFTAQLLLGLRRELTGKIKARLAENWQTIHEALLSKETLRESVDECLRLEATRGPLQLALKAEIDKIFWGIIIEAISSSVSDPESDSKQSPDPDSDPKQSPDSDSDPKQSPDSDSDSKQSPDPRPERKFTLADIWNAALCGGLSGAKEAVQGFKGTISNEQAFHQVWFTAGDQALAAAKSAAARDIAGSNKSKREAMWNSNWEVWDACWKEIHKITEPRTVHVAEKIVREISVTGTATIFEGMAASGSGKVTVQATTADTQSSRSITFAGLETDMNKIIWMALGFPLPGRDEVFDSMQSVWKCARPDLQDPQQRLGNNETRDISGMSKPPIVETEPKVVRGYMRRFLQRLYSVTFRRASR